MNTHSNYLDLIDLIAPMLAKSLGKYSWSSVTNGYYKENDKYFIGYRLSGRSFPIVVTLVMDFPWKYKQWNGELIGTDV
jgi:hypothetical protein